MSAETMASPSSSESVEHWTHRQDYLSDYDYFMALALLTGQRSEDPDKQGGACIVKDNKVIAVGSHQVIPEYHAETDAILKCADAHGCTMFVTEFPCSQCMKVIIQAGIRSVICLSDDPIPETNETNASKKMLSEEIDFKKYQPQRDEILIKCVQERDRTSIMADSDYFMAVALLTAERSRDPNTQVGACIVRDKKVIAVGHNQMPNDHFAKYTWDRDLEKDNKYFYVCHAEHNAILSSSDVRGCSIYVTLFPCSDCAKLIIGAGVNTVVYLSDKYADRDDTKTAKKILHSKHKFYPLGEETLVICLTKSHKQQKIRNPTPGERYI